MTAEDARNLGRYYARKFTKDPDRIAGDINAIADMACHAYAIEPPSVVDVLLFDACFKSGYQETIREGNAALLLARHNAEQPTGQAAAVVDDNVRQHCKHGQYRSLCPECSDLA